MSSTQEVGEIFGAGAGPAHAMLRSPTVLIAAVGLWGMNIYFFRLFGIDYIKVLNHDLLKMEQEMEHSHHQHHHRRAAKIGNTRKDSSGEGNCNTNNNTNSNNTSADNSILLDSFSDGEEQMEEIEHSIMENNAAEEYSEEITSGRLVCLSLTLLILLHFSYSLWIDWLGGGSVGAVFAFYGAVVIAILFPLPSTRWLRHAGYIVVTRTMELFNPRCRCPPGSKLPRPIPFVDVFFADAMCSFSKVFFDWGMLLHMAAYYPRPVRQSAYNILIPSVFAAVPYLIRARQCLVMWNYTQIKNDPGRYQHLWNALKYSTSIWPLCLSAYQKTVAKTRAHDLEMYLILLLFINASYSLFWDVVMDWGMMKNPSAAAIVFCNPASVNGLTNSPYQPIAHHQRGEVKRNPSGSVAPHSSATSFSCWYALLRNRLRYGVPVSVLILVTDAILRFSWVLRFYHTLFPSGDSFVLTTQFLEVFRRAIWNLLRVEWENLKQSGQHLPPSVSRSQSNVSIQLAPIAPNMIPTDDEKAAFLVQRAVGASSQPPIRLPAKKGKDKTAKL